MLIFQMAVYDANDRLIMACNYMVMSLNSASSALFRFNPPAPLNGTRSPCISKTTNMPALFEPSCC